MLAANQPLVVPMLLRLSNFRLNSVVVLVVSKQKGITLVFKTDPLQNVDISSTFDSIAVIQKFIQKEIEGQLRQMFREDLPSIIHRVSQQWIKKSTTVEAPYLTQRRRDAMLETASNPDFPPRGPTLKPGMHPLLSRRDYLGLPVMPRRSSFSQRTMPRRPSLTSMRSTPNITEDHSFDYASQSEFSDAGDRHALSHLGRIHRESRGLADLTEESSEFGGTEADSFDVVDWEDTMTDILEVNHQPPRVAVTEYESIPAVGGGTITRPRVYHSTSMQRTNSGSSDIPSQLALNSIQTSFSNARRLSEDSIDSRLPPSRRDSWDSRYVHPDLLDNAIRNQVTHQRIDDGEVEDLPYNPGGPASTSTVPTSPIGPVADDAHLRSRRSSVSLSSRAPPPSSPFLSAASDIEDPDGEPKIILRPNANSAISQLSLLNRSNNTLSPFTRTTEHFTTRSLPPRNVVMRGRMNTNPTERQPVKAKRKRTYRLGGKNSSSANTADTQPESPVAGVEDIVRVRSRVPSDFDESEIDEYFRPPYLHSFTADATSHVSPSQSRHRASFVHREL